MNLEEKIELVKHNTVEVVSEDELEALLKAKKQPVTYCGYEPSGEMHLGHMATTGKLIDMENAGFKVKVLFADWHAWLNRKGTWEEIGELAKVWGKVYRKLGLKNAEYVLGSSFQRKNDYIDDMLKLSLGITIKRGVRAMQEVARDMESGHISQIIYPLMQITDFKHLKVDAAQAGIDQRKIHMLAREVLPEIGYIKPVVAHTPLITSLQGEGTKMSSSSPNSLISARDSEKDVEKKIAKAFCPEKKVDGNPVLEIAKLVVFPRVDKIAIKRPEKFGGNVEYNNYNELSAAFAGGKLHPADLKKAVSEELNAMLAPVRKEFE